MIKYIGKQVDPLGNITYGDLSTEELTMFTYEDSRKVPLRVEAIGITHPCPDYKIERKHCDSFVLEYVVSGKGHIHCDGNDYDVNEDSVYLLQVGSCHQYWSDRKEPYEKIWINFFSGVFSDLLAAYGITHDKIVFPNSGCKKYFEELLRVAEESSNSDEVYLRVSEVLFQIMLQLVRAGEQVARSSSIAYLIKEALDRNVYRKITIEQVARECNVSKSQATREFKKVYSVSPYQYMLNRKIALAQKMLAGTSMRVYEISEQLGFSDEYYFSDVFKAKTGSSPRLWRVQQKTKSL